MDRKIIKLIAVVLIIVIVGGVAFFLGDKHGVQSMTVKRVTPDQAAAAMKGDYFYSKYRENTLLVSGTVSTVTMNSTDMVVTFKTSSSFKAQCDFSSSVAMIHPKDNITALSEAGSAERQPSAVLLKNCVLP